MASHYQVFLILIAVAVRLSLQGGNLAAGCATMGGMAKRIAVAFSILSVAALDAASLTSIERQRLVAHLEVTAAWLTDEVSGLTAAQLAFRPSSTSWSIAQVLDHLVVVGPIYWRDLQNALKVPMKGRSSTSTDADILWYGIDRTNREAAIPSELPKSTTSDVRAALDEYRKSHTRLLQYVKITNDDLRGHYVERQGSDAYQWALLISSHEQRHILQIREIKAHPKFPR